MVLRLKSSAKGESRQKYPQEAKARAGNRHPNVVALSEAGGIQHKRKKSAL